VQDPENPQLSLSEVNDAVAPADVGGQEGDNIHDDLTQPHLDDQDEQDSGQSPQSDSYSDSDSGSQVSTPETCSVHSDPSDPNSDDSNVDAPTDQEPETGEVPLPGVSPTAIIIQAPPANDSSEDEEADIHIEPPEVAAIDANDNPLEDAGNDTASNVNYEVSNFFTSSISYQYYNYCFIFVFSPSTASTTVNLRTSSNQVGPLEGEGHGEGMLKNWKNYERM
jgi:hypothetical protein